MQSPEAEATVLGTLARIPMVSWMFSWAHTVFSWLKYFKSSDEPVILNDLLFAGAQVFGVVLLSWQVSMYGSALGYTREAEVLILAAIMALWGLALLVQGVRKRRILMRVVGVCILLTPVVQHVLDHAKNSAAVLAWLALTLGLATGLGSWFVLNLKSASSRASSSG